MATKIWDKGGATDAAMLRYTARDDWRLDQRLLAYDLRATLAHARGLGRIGILSADEVASLERALGELSAENEAGKLVLTEADEDGHSAIESALVERLGDVGKKVHTGRSRNDQVLTAMRLYERDALADLADAARAGGIALLELAEKHRDVPLPGYTHLQRAMPSSVGLWASSFAEGLADSIEVLASARALADRSPLGAAASFGVNIPLDREGVASELGFAGVALNPLASQTSRGIVEVVLLTAAWHPMAVVRRLAWDLSLFTTSEFAFVKLDDAFTTGSSIMPQKRNPDVVELMRAACSVVQGAIAEVQGITALPAGYHRDLQLTKAPTMRGLDEALATVRLLPRLIASMTLDVARMKAAVSPETFATDRAVELAVAGVPFRDAYKQVAAEVKQMQAGDAAASLSARVSLGAPGNLQLERLAARLRGS